MAKYVIVLPDDKAGTPGYKPVFVIQAPSIDGGFSSDWQFTRLIAEATIFYSITVARHAVKSEKAQRGMSSKGTAACRILTLR